MPGFQWGSIMASEYEPHLPSFLRCSAKFINWPPTLPLLPFAGRLELAEVKARRARYVALYFLARFDLHPCAQELGDQRPRTEHKARRW